MVTNTTINLCYFANVYHKTFKFPTRIIPYLPSSIKTLSTNSTIIEYIKTKKEYFNNLPNKMRVLQTEIDLDIQWKCMKLPKNIILIIKKSAVSISIRPDIEQMYNILRTKTFATLINVYSESNDNVRLNYDIMYENNSCNLTNAKYIHSQNVSRYYLCYPKFVTTDAKILSDVKLAMNSDSIFTLDDLIMKAHQMFI